MIRAEEISKYVGRTPLLTGVTCSVERGECVALVGRDSRARSVMLGILGTIVRPTAGRLQIAGVDALRFGGRVRGEIMWAGRCGGVGDEMDAADYVRFIVAARRGRPPAAGLVASELERCGVDATRPVRLLDDSERQLLDLIAVTLVRPAVLLWDDAVPIQPTGASSRRERLREIAAAGTAIVCAAQPASEIAANCDRSVRIDSASVDDAPFEYAVGVR